MAKHDEWAKKQKSNPSSNRTCRSRKKKKNEANLAAEEEETSEEQPSANAAVCETDCDSDEEDFISMTGLMQVSLE